MARDIAPGDEIEFDYLTPVSDEGCNAQIARSLGSGLVDATPRKAITVVANGPSAKLAPLTGTTVALNGALRLFNRAGIAPTYYACCDPQELVAEFLADAPKATTYLVASKCHPAVFLALTGHAVRLWHLKDFEADGRLRTPLCSSVTLSAMWMLTRLGFTDFEVYGWDACYLDGEHHAGDAAPDYTQQPNFVRLNYGGELVAGEVIGGRTYDTTRTWAAEARGAEQFFQLADYMDLRVNIHGDGMIKAVRQNILGD